MTTIIVNTGSDTPAPNLITLREALDQVSVEGTITFAGDVCSCILTQGPLVLSSPKVVVVMGSTVIYQGSDCRAIEVNNTEVRLTLIGLTLAGPCTVQPLQTIPPEATVHTGGGLFINSGSVVLIDCVLVGNATNGFGGAISSFGSIDMTRCVLQGNYASKSGGAVACESDPNASLSLTDCTIYNNTAQQDGAGLFIGWAEKQDQVIIRNSTFTHNRCGRDGGAIARGQGSPRHGETMGLLLTNSTIYHNICGRNGGGISFDNMNTADILNIENTVISSNTSNEIGGGIYFRSTYSVLNIRSCDVCFNAAVDGSAIMNINGCVSITGSNLTHNTSYAQIDSSAVVNAESGVLDIASTVISNNQRVEGQSRTDSCRGIRNDGILSVDFSFISNNKALVEGGGLLNTSQLDADLRHALISTNYASKGAGVGNTGSLVVDGAVIAANVAISDGGGIATRGIMNLLNSSVLFNAAQSGGGIVNEGSAIISYTSICSNKAVDRGGAVCSASNLRTERSLVSNNTAKYGGGIWSKAQAQLVCSTLALNTGLIQGGALMITEGDAKLVSCTLADNMGSGTAGVWIEPNVTAFVLNSIISGNKNETNTHGFIDQPTFGNYIGPGAKLLNLSYNGGPTMTMPLAVTSPAIGVGKDIHTVPGGDQRGLFSTVGKQTDAGACASGLAQGSRSRSLVLVRDLSNKISYTAPSKALDAYQIYDAKTRTFVSTRHRS